MAGLPGSVRLRTVPWPVVLGLAAMFVPVYLELGQRNGLDDGIAPPIIALAGAWLFWRLWPRLRGLDPRPARAAGALTLGFGLVLYVLGRILGFPPAEVASQLPVLAGLLLLYFGWPGLRLAAFPVFFLIFMVPLPGAVVVELTGPLRLWGAELSAEVLHVIGYPVAISGTIISIGQYLLLVNEACSGLGSMFSLVATCLLYIHITGHRARLHLAVLLLSVLPIAFLANTLRILGLALLTYHAGDGIAQGPAHETSGVMLFVVALGMLFGLDALVRRWSPERP